MRKPRLYVAVYHSRKQPRPENPSETAAALYAALRSGEFPYDGGDDPSFFSARHFDGPVTWGVCRADVRSAIRRGDWVVFFSKQDDEDGVTRYRFVAALSVEDKIPHTALPGSPFSRYLNHLIRPSGGGWERHEPSLHRRHWHDGDWLWRLCRDRGLGRTKGEVNVEAKRHQAGQPLPLPPACNYVVFSKSSAVMARQPPVVATYRPGEVYETWKSDPGSQAIRRVVLGDSGRGLRIDNVQRAHRHFWRPLNDPSWPKALRDALSKMDANADEGVAGSATLPGRPASRRGPC